MTRACQSLTDGAMLSGPALVTFTFSVFAGAVFSAAWVTRFKIAHGTRPAFLAATTSPYTHSVGATVHCAHLCKHKQIEITFFVWTSAKLKDYKFAPAGSTLLPLPKTRRTEVAFLRTITSKLLTLSVKNLWQEIDNCGPPLGLVGWVVDRLPHLTQHSITMTHINLVRPGWVFARYVRSLRRRGAS